MNIWECQFPHCGRRASGVGGAIGLRAIGWYYRQGTGTGLTSLRGPDIRCPAHRPDGIKCTEPANDRPCRLCAGEAEARQWQAQMEAAEVAHSEMAPVPE